MMSCVAGKASYGLRFEGVGRMNRREFLTSAGIGTAALALPRASQVFAESGWRTFEIVTRVEVMRPSGATRIWVPTPLAIEMPFQRKAASTFKADGGRVRIVEEQPDALGILVVDFPAGVQPLVTLINRVATRDFSVDLSQHTRSTPANEQNLDHFLQPTKLIPTDGIVKSTALKITSGCSSDREKAQAIYSWIIENTFRNPKTRGCGTGDIRFMLETGDLGGKCADLNALFVGLARAVEVPARDVYGIRVAKSNLGYKSLGPATPEITKAQHCRAEVYLGGYGWVPVDPADVRKVVLEEPPGNRPLDDSMVSAARSRLFGTWEMNWMAYNFAHDVVLPGSKGAPVGYFMYPQAETDGGRIDPLDPDNFHYSIEAREI
jgi:transglutaminase-like putative cysteine protease